MREFVTVKDSDAYILRENTGTTGLELTARTAASILADHDIPHFIIGGLAVQEHGYPRLTLDIDIVVPDVLEAVEFLTADLTGPFARIPTFQDRLVDRRNQVKLDFLPAGQVVKHGCKVPFPTPVQVTGRPQFIGLAGLISLKLDSSNNSPLRRSQDRADVIQLISLRNLPRDFDVAPAVRELYRETWDALKSET